MQIQINTDGNVEGNDALADHVSGVLRHALKHVSGKISRLEVHLSDENSDRKTGQADMRCLLEARLAGMKPISVSDEAATLDQAVDGAVGKLKRMVASTLGRLDAR